jgi:hypothetical protein
MKNFNNVQKRSFKIYQIVFVLIFFLFLLNLNSVEAVWEPPGPNPPEGNVSAPLNQGSTPQFKKGGLHLGATQAMENYQFSVKDGKSYLEGDLEVSDVITMTASNGNINMKGSLDIQGDLDLNGGTLDIDDGMVDIVNAVDSSVLYVQASAANAVAISGSSLTGVGVKGVSASGIAVEGNVAGVGTGVYGWTLDASAIGIVGYNADPDGLAGRFDGTVRFRPVSGNDFTEIDGGELIFNDGTGRTIEITPPNLIVSGNIQTTNGDILVDSGNIWITAGFIDLNKGNIINLAKPIQDLDAVNKKYVDDEIISGAGDDDWIISGGADAIYRLTGNVGIGTNSPETPLTIVRSDGSPQILSILSDDTGAEIQIADADSGWDAADGSIFGHVDQDLNIYNQEQGDISIYTSNDSSKGIRINSLGNVGIGTDSPTQKLDIRNGRLHIERTSGIVAPQIELYDTSGIDGEDFTIISKDGKFKVSHDIDASTSENRFTIDSSGNIGIGTETPSVKLDVEVDSGNGTAIRGFVNNPAGNLLILDSPYFSGSHAFSVDVRGNTDIQGDVTVSGDVFQIGGGLDVSGDSILGDSSSEVYMPGGATLNNGLAIQSGGLQVDGDIDATGDICDGTGSCLSAVSGSFWADGGDNKIYYNDGNVGIGTVAPSSVLEVVGDIEIGANELKKDAAGGPSIGFDASGNVVVTIP